MNKFFLSVFSNRDEKDQEEVARRDGSSTNVDELSTALGDYQTLTFR